MGPCLQEIPKHRSHFFMKKSIARPGSDFKIFWGLHLSEPWKILKIWCIFVAKSQEIGFVPFFFRNIPNYEFYLWKKVIPEHGYGSWAVPSQGLGGDAKSHNFSLILWLTLEWEKYLKWPATWSMKILQNQQSLKNCTSQHCAGSFATFQFVQGN